MSNTHFLVFFGEGSYMILSLDNFPSMNNLRSILFYEKYIDICSFLLENHSILEKSILNFQRKIRKRRKKYFWKICLELMILSSIFEKNSSRPETYLNTFYEQITKLIV